MTLQFFGDLRSLAVQSSVFLLLTSSSFFLLRLTLVHLCLAPLTLELPCPLVHFFPGAVRLWLITFSLRSLLKIIDIRFDIITSILPSSSRHKRWSFHSTD